MHDFSVPRSQSRSQMERLLIADNPRDSLRDVHYIQQPGSDIKTRER